MEISVVKKGGKHGVEEVFYFCWFGFAFFKKKKFK